MSVYENIITWKPDQDQKVTYGFVPRYSSLGTLWYGEDVPYGAVGWVSEDAPYCPELIVTNVISRVWSHLLDSQTSYYGWSDGDFVYYPNIYDDY